jgi:hydrogenase-4 component F
MLEILLSILIFTGIISYFLKVDLQKKSLTFVSIIHICFSIVFFFNDSVFFNNYLELFSISKILIILTSIIFLMTVIYSYFYFSDEELTKYKLYIPSMIFFLVSMTLVLSSNNMIVVWIAVEATTLTSAPLIFAHKTGKSLEATWKYIMICSVGIALALLGTFMINIGLDGNQIDLNFSSLLNADIKIRTYWFKAGFIFIIVGYGTKMGLAPMHTWLPDAHSEAPSPASALLSGTLLNCAFYPILKYTKILNHFGMNEFTTKILLILGLTSIFIAAIFILKQNDYKRLFAYSSIENMGIIAIGTAVGGLGTIGVILHMINHSLIKSSLFLFSGNILKSYKTKILTDINNLQTNLPFTSKGIILSILAISGFPPFGIFFSELLIMFSLFKNHYYISATIFIISLIMASAGLTKHSLTLCYSTNTHLEKINMKEPIISFMPQFLLLVLSVLTFFIIFTPLINKIITLV